MNSYLVVGQGVIVEEKPGCNVECHEDVDGVVLMCGEDEEYPEHVQEPCHRVEEVQMSWSICENERGGLKALETSLMFSLTFSDEEVQYRQGNCVAAEHVIAARSDALDRHAQPAPNVVSSGHPQRDSVVRRQAVFEIQNQYSPPIVLSVE